MKTLERIKLEVFATEIWTEQEDLDGVINEVAKRYAKEVAREALKNASEKSQDMMYYVADEADDNIEGLLRLKRRVMQSCYAVPKQTVLNESNIPEL